MNDVVLKILEKNQNWQPPELSEQLPFGDMPGDEIKVKQSHIDKANTIFPVLMQLMSNAAQRTTEKIVVSICGGSGVGKSETATVISDYLCQIGLKSYTLSGDNYPHRIPKYNDAERLRVFREYGINELISKGVYSNRNMDIIRKFQEADIDTSREHDTLFPWYSEYINGGMKGYRSYLGTEKEINFKLLNGIIDRFKKGEQKIMLKRMGRSTSDIWYDEVGFSDIQVLVIEWTHGNNDNLNGVDISVLLNSTPKETLEHRRKRNRDSGVDSPFITRVLESEQELLASQAHKADIIVSKAGDILSYQEYLDYKRELNEQ